MVHQIVGLSTRIKNCQLSLIPRIKN